MTNTTNYNLKKPEDNDNVLIGDLNENADAIDQALHGLEEGKAAKAKPARAGSLAALDESGNLTDSGRTPGAAGGVATLDESGKVPETQLPEMNYDPAGSADAVQQALNSHASNKQNPHGVTAKQAGADPAGTASSAVSSHNQDEEAHPALRAKLNSVSMAVKATYPIADGQTITAGDVVDVVEGKVVGSKKPLSDFAEGDIIQLNENGKAADFYVAKHNYETGLNGAGRTLLIRKNVYGTFMAFDQNRDSDFETSTLSSFLNSDYKNALDEDVRSKIGTTKFYTSNGASNVVLEKSVFVLSMTELGKSNVNAPSGEGSFISATSKFVIANTETGSAVGYWLRTLRKYESGYVFFVNPSGSVDSTAADNSIYYARPAFTLPADFLISDGTSPSQAIALQGGTEGQTIEVIYSGTVYADWVTAGQTITSNGVYGVGVLDGVLQVWSAERPGQIVTGSYTGTGQNGLSTQNSLSFNRQPLAVIISDNSGAYNGIFIYGSSYGPVLTGSSNYKNTLSWSANVVSWYTDSGAGPSAQLNASGTMYHYTAFLGG